MPQQRAKWRKIRRIIPDDEDAARENISFWRPDRLSVADTIKIEDDRREWCLSGVSEQDGDDGEDSLSRACGAGKAAGATDCRHTYPKKKKKLSGTYVGHPGKVAEIAEPEISTGQQALCAR